MALLRTSAKVVIYLLISLFIIGVTLLVVDHYALSRPASPAHSENTAKLPMLDEKTTDGWVRIQANDMTFRARVANLGKKDAESVILLHGFPETSEMWDPLFNKLTEQGYRVVAFDQRGYSPGARPSKVEDYAMANLVGDLNAVADAVGFERFHLVGHDWGASVGWSAVQPDQTRVASFVSLAIPHVNSFADALASDPEQQKSSRYIAIFRTPFVGEKFLLFNNGYLLRNKVYEPMTPQMRDFYTQVFLEPGAMTAVLNWYRENFKPGPRPRLKPVSVPTLYMWGNRDKAVARGTARGGEKYMAGPYRFVEIDASHWMIEDDPDRVVSEVLKHLQQYPMGAS